MELRTLSAAPLPLEHCTLAEYYDMLARFDWYYAAADDHRAYLAGQARERDLMHLARCSPEHAELFRAFSKAMFSGDAFGRPPVPLPTRPEVD